MGTLAIHAVGKTSKVLTGKRGISSARPFALCFFGIT